MKYPTNITQALFSRHDDFLILDLHVPSYKRLSANKEAKSEQKKHDDQIMF